jgi:hypothetical protein
VVGEGEDRGRSLSRLLLVRKSRRLVVLVCAALLVTILAIGFAVYRASAPLSINDRIGIIYQHSHARSISLNFPKYVPGNWTQLTVVCGPVRGRVINRALGFRWAKPSSVQPSNGSTILFSTKSAVVSSFAAGVDDLNSNEYFVPCFPPGIPDPMVEGKVQVRQVIAVPRRDSTLTLTADHAGVGWPIWYFTSAERDSLLKQYGSIR